MGGSHPLSFGFFCTACKLTGGTAAGGCWGNLKTLDCNEKKTHKTRWYILENNLKKRFPSAYISINHLTSPLLQPCPQPLTHSLFSLYMDLLLSNSFNSHYIFQCSQTVHYIQWHHYPEHRLLDFHATLFFGVVNSLCVSFTNNRCNSPWPSFHQKILTGKLSTGKW